MKVAGCVVLHYGLEYLSHTLKSISDFVDEIHISYSPHPTHGSRAPVPCPETEDQLRSAANLPKVNWQRVTAFWREGEHRDYAMSLCRDYDLVLVADADEPWDGEVLDKCLKHAWDNSAQTWRLNFSTPWRSFNWLCRDNMWPDRIHDNRSGRADRWGYLPKDLGEHYHFGYCISNSVLTYKIAIHGHRSEWREEWYRDKWLAWPPVADCHPTCLNTWTTEPFDKNLLPPVLHDHPYWNLDKVE